MYCNEICNKIVIFLILLMIITDIQIVAIKHQEEIDMEVKLGEGTSGDLYNIFKKRLLVITNELAYHKFNDLEQQSTKALEKRTSDGSERKNSIYKSFYNKELKHQLNNQMLRSINRNSKNGQRSLVRRKFYELYRKKIDELNNKSFLNSEKIVDRNGRSFFNWFRKGSKTNENSPQYNTSKLDPLQLNKQLLNMTKTINEDNAKFLKLLDILKKESNFTNSIAIRDTLNQEFLEQMKIINNAMTPLEKRIYRQVKYLNKHNYDKNLLQDEDCYDNIDWDFDNQNKDYEFWNLLPKKAISLNHRKRQVTTNNVNTRSLETNALYPSVLTKALEISLNPSVHANSSSSLLTKVAQKMNTTTLDLAEKIAKSSNTPNDGHLDKVVHNFMINDADHIPVANSYKPIVYQGATNSSPAKTVISENLQAYPKNEEIPNGVTTSSLTRILDRVLTKLESIHDGKNDDNEEHPDGAPCDIVGSWSSITLGLCFDIKLNKDNIRSVSPAEVNNKMLLIEAQECTPQRSHNIVDLEWKFGGSALKTMGGPFYIYAQKRSESLVGTFLGYCRTCGSIDTIYGAWTFSSPSRNYYDISLAFDVKRDLLRRDRMEIKRKERFKDLLYQSRSGNLNNL